MHLYIELWNVKQAWLDLSKEERQNYVVMAGGAIQELLKTGVEIVGWSLNDEDTDHRSGHQYFAVWKFPTKESAQGFEGLVTQAGWHNYFDQVSAGGTLADPPTVLGHSINL